MRTLGWWNVSVSYTEGAALEHIKAKGLSIEEYARNIAGKVVERDHPQRAELVQGIIRDLREYADKHNIVVA